MITIEDYVKMVSGEAEPTEEQKTIAQKIFESVEEDIKGLKATNVMLKEEKKKEKDAHQADIEKFAEAEKKYQEEIKTIREQSKTALPEEERKYYEQQMEILQNGLNAQIAERDRKIEQFMETVKDYEKKDLLRSQEVEFERLVRKTNADPSAYDTIKLMVLGNGDRFNSVKTAEGEMFLATNGTGKSIGNSIDEFLSSAVGKRLCNNTSSGAGAEGGARAQSSVHNPWKKESWNETEQMKLYMDNPQLAKQLELAAKNS